MCDGHHTCKNYAPEYEGSGKVFADLYCPDGSFLRRACVADCSHPHDNGYGAKCYAQARNHPKYVKLQQLVEDLSDSADQDELPAGPEGLNSTRYYRIPDYLIFADDEKILDWFHEEVPIGMLEEFQWDVVTEIPEGGVDIV